MCGALRAYVHGSLCVRGLQGVRYSYLCPYVTDLLSMYVVSAWLTTCVAAYLCACVVAYRRAYMHVPICLHACILRTFVAAYLRAYVPAWLQFLRRGIPVQTSVLRVSCLRAFVLTSLRGCVAVWLRAYVAVYCIPSCSVTACLRGCVSTCLRSGVLRSCMGLADDILHVPVCQCTAYLSVFVCNYVPARQRTGFLCAFVAAHCCLRVFMCLRGCIYLRACMPTYVHAYMAVSLYCVSMCLRGGVLRAFVAEYLRAYVPVWLGSTCLRALVTEYL